MTIHVYIVGTAHRIQCGNTKKTAQEKIVAYQKEISDICSQYKVRRVAEEMSIDGLRRQAVDKTIGNRIATDTGICHQYVDVDRSARAELSLDDALPVVASLNVDDANQHRLIEGVQKLRDEFRERVWIARIISHNTWPVLFVCGSDHVTAVHELFRQLGMNSSILHSDFDP